MRVLRSVSAHGKGIVFRSLTTGTGFGNTGGQAGPNTIGADNFIIYKLQVQARTTMRKCYDGMCFSGGACQSVYGADEGAAGRKGGTIHKPVYKIYTCCGIFPGNAETISIMPIL